MKLWDVKFKRKFSISPYKNMKIPMAEMSFAKDFVNDRRGDLYPVIARSSECVERVADNTYTAHGEVTRFFCQFFPYGSYRLVSKVCDGEVGFAFSLPSCRARVTLGADCIKFASESGEGRIQFQHEGKTDVTVSCRPGAFDIYTEKNGALYLGSFACPDMNTSNKYTEFSSGYAALFVSGEATVYTAESFVDNGISIADIRPIRYENGDVMIESGKIYLTASVRLEAGCYQGVFSWIPGTAELSMTGAIFFDAGDGVWAPDVASSVLYDRERGKWLLWVCSFFHDHVLAHAELDADVRFGVNAVDVILMEKTKKPEDPTDFAAHVGDEDPDFFYSEKNKKWYMGICRLDPRNKKYNYEFFASDSPFDGYHHIGSGEPGEETGGSFVRVRDESYFVCGNGFRLTSNYRIYSDGEMKCAEFDFPDGGFRGWGSVIPVKLGTRTRFFWLTFDRHKGSDYNWSYGNLYCFEGDM